MMHPQRIGHGWDLHRLAPNPPQGDGRPMRLGGVALDSPAGPVAHSDGDALLHAITDALLAAAGLDDLGTTWPDTDAAHDGADSGAFLQAAARALRQHGWEVGNISATVVCEAPKIGPRREEMQASIAALLGCDPEQIHVKGKTHEGVDAVGASQAIEVHAVALIHRAS